ncbi:autotransporter outer membrane beta-barrel domain-containing protein, partial [Escherichia coli]|nr:autotransporter outer membrane beta-barrel domain-containing protein [Escherichia coli]
MNNIYALKYSSLTGGLIAVSELTRRVSQCTRKRLFASCALLSVISSPVSVASQLYTDNFWVRDYLDLAQNKGAFKAGAKDIYITTKNGNKFYFPDVPVPDFSAASNNGASTSIGGAYSVTAAHYSPVHHGITTQSWGQTLYNKIDRMTAGDFAVSRLNKFVVETTGATDYADVTLSAEQALERYGIEYNGKRQIIGLRVGSGITEVVQDNVKYNTNKTYVPELLSASMFTVNWNAKTVDNDFNGFRNETMNGDSGSGYYIYDNVNQRWVLLGTHWGIIKSNGDKYLSMFERYNAALVENIKSFFSQKIKLDGQNVLLKKDALLIDDESYEIKLTRNNKNKDLSISGGGTLSFSEAVDLGTGGFIFEPGHQYHVNGNGTFKGAGIDIGKDSVVNWNIRYASGDNLHKTGEGTLNVTTTQGTNLKTGNGTVILAAENTFDNIYMAGGKGTVRLDSGNALNSTSEYRGIFFTEKGGTLDLNGHSLEFERIAATDAGTTITNSTDRTAVLSLNNKINYIYHGNIDKNISLKHGFSDRQNNAHLILDGSMNITGNIDVKNVPLVMQGHATTHAIFREGGISCRIPGIPLFCDKDYVSELKNKESAVNSISATGYKTSNQVASFGQPDWENRYFRFGRLNLVNADFSVGRNAYVEGEIVAKDSSMKFGNATVWIDYHAGKNITDSGFSFRQDVKQGNSVGESRFSGAIYSEGGSINIGDNASVILTKSSSIDGTPLTIARGGEMTALGGLFTSKKVNIGGQMKLTGTPDGHRFYPAIYIGYGGYNLTDDGARFTAGNQATVIADITADKAANIFLGKENHTGNQYVTASSVFARSLLNGFDTSLEGKINASKSALTMNDALWKVNGHSSLNKFSSHSSMLLFSGDKQTFSTLAVDELTTHNSAYAMRTDLKNSDKLVVNQKLSGKDNILLVDFLNKPTEEKLDIELVSAPGNSSKDVFKGSEQAIGFSNVTPVITAKDAGEKTTWNLTGYRMAENPAATQSASGLASVGYKSFLSEVNNLNKRMGDLRNINGEAGAWARIMSGTGSASGGFSDNYTHVQVGVDKKHELDGLDLFTGFTVTHTDSSASADAFRGKTKSVGAGLYASAMFDSGAYIDLIGKYVHHDNEYTATFAGLGTRDYSTHSWYAGAEAGYRYHVTEDVWIEPQAELVYGAVSGKQFAWKDQGMHLSMKDRDYNPLIGRTGVDVGKSFSGKDWKVTARAGLGYQFDLLANGETVLRDASGEKRIKGEK